MLFVSSRSPALLNVVNCFSVPTPRRLRFKVLSSSKLLVSWKEPKGDFDSYLFLYNSIPGRIILLWHTHRLKKKNKNKPYAKDMWDLTLKVAGKDPVMIWIFLSVIRDYVIYFLSKLLWRDQSPERCGRLKVCAAPLPSLRQRSVFAVYVELSADLEIGPIDIKDRKTLAHSALSPCDCVGMMDAWRLAFIPRLSVVSHRTDTRHDLVSFRSCTVQQVITLITTDVSVIMQHTFPHRHTYPSPQIFNCCCTAACICSELMPSWALQTVLSPPRYKNE